MAKLLAILGLAASIFLAAPASAQWNGCAAGFCNPVVTGGGGGNDPVTTAWVNAVVAAGGTVSGTQTTRVNNLVVAIRSAGLISRGFLWLWGGESSAQQAKIDILKLQSLTVVGGMTLAAGGYTSDGSTGYLNLGIAPSNAALSQNSTSYGLYDRTAASGQNNGLISINNAVFFCPYFGSSFAIADINDSSFGTVATTNSQGRWTMARTASNLITLYRNGSSVGTVSSTSQTPSSANVFAFAQNDGAGNPSAFVSPDQLAGLWMFDGLNSTEQAALDAALATYFSAWGI